MHSSNDAALRMNHQLLLSRNVWAELKNFCPLYLVGIAKEFVNGHLGSWDLGIYQNTIPNMERDIERGGKIVVVRSKEY